MTQKIKKTSKTTSVTNRSITRSKTKIAKTSHQRVVAKKTSRKASSERILENCKNIINVAISSKLSLRATCLSLGFGKNYVSEVRITLAARVFDGRFTKKQATEFTRLYKAYQKAYKTA